MLTKKYINNIVKLNNSMEGIYEKISEPEILPSASLRRGCSSGIALLHSKSSFFNASMIVLNPAKSAPCMSVMRELNTNTTGTIKINTKITVLKNAANTSYLRYFKSISYVFERSILII